MSLKVSLAGIFCRILKNHRLIINNVAVRLRSVIIDSQAYRQRFFLGWEFPRNCHLKDYKKLIDKVKIKGKLSIFSIKVRKIRKKN